jgi:pimeloyl-ACP methyl ester carboxylesterase
VSIRRRVLAAAAGLALVATACTQTTAGRPTGSPAASGRASASAPASEPLAFRDCTAALVSAGLPVPARLKGKLAVGCGRLSVPLDYGNPGGRKITLAVLRMHDTDNPAPIGSLLMNPGGPGVSGLQFSLAFLAQVPLDVIGKFDLIGFDPRGVGQSSPIRCLSDAAKDRMLATSPDITTAAGFAAARADSIALSRACQRAGGSALPFYNTVDTARDMDRIRRAVEDHRMNYLGFSYGTQLGWVYAHLFPKTVRALVLDGAVDPDTSPVEQAAEQLQGFEDAFDEFATNCRSAPPCNQMTDPRGTVMQIAAAARDRPLITGSDRRLTYGLALTGVLYALYSKSFWPRLATALISATNGDGSGLLRLADAYNERTSSGQYSNVQDANTAISCNDSPPGPNERTIKTTAATWAREFPMFGTWSAPSLLSCAGWQPHRTLVPAPRAATPVKVLVVGNLHDPATPYRGAQDLTHDLGNATLLTWNGEGHTSYRHGSSCIDNYVDAYLLSESLPPGGITCPR